MEADAEVKAQLAHAYASGERPHFSGVATSGRDEVWILAGILFLVPIIPPGTDVDLEYALRVHRDALFTGQCEHCSATVDLKDARFDAGMLWADSIIDHRRTCPAYTTTRLKRLNDHYTSQGQRSFYETLDDASVRTLHSVRADFADTPMRAPTSSIQEWAASLKEEYTSPDKIRGCDHLFVNPAQTWNISLDVDEWRCDECWAHFKHYAGAEQGTACGRCRREAPEGSDATVLRIGTLLIHTQLCRECSKEPRVLEQPTEEES